jgi:hypothetical protein
MTIVAGVDFGTLSVVHEMMALYLPPGAWRVFGLA